MDENKTHKPGETITPVADTSIPPKPKSAVPKGEGKFSKIKKWFSTHKKETILIAAVVIALGAVGGVFAYTQLKKKPMTPAAQPAPEQKAEEPAAPTTLPSPLTGVQVAPELASRPVTAMVVENSIDARPQSGLTEAGVVFEATAEGGITRFLAMFQDTRPALIGPARSLRPYFIDFALPFQASVGHVGGSPDALAEARIVGLRDIDQGNNAAFYWRATDRYAPHNVYTSTDKLDQLLQQKGFTKSEFTPWARQEGKALEVPAASTINLDISSANYKAVFNYDKASNTYLRSVGGKPHVNREDGKQITPKVVIAIKTPHRIIDSAGHYGMTLVGSGEAHIFMDGGVTPVTWEKTARQHMFRFKDATGKEVPISAGQTWITLLPTGKASALSFGP